MKRASVVFVVYCVLTLALTFPLIMTLGTALPNDPGDPALNTWILWWNAHALPYTARWWDAPAFYPVRGSLAFSENLIGLSLVSTPLQWLGANPQTAYNVVFLLTFPLCGLGAFLLVRALIARDDAAFIAGLLFGFAPYRIAHLPQIQCLAAFPIPFALLGLHQYVRDQRARWLVLFGVAWLLQAMCNGYYMLFFAVVIGLWLLWFATLRPRVFAGILATWVVASLPLAPLLWQYRAIHDGFGFARDFGTIRDFGADIAALLNAAGSLRLWGWLRVYRHAEGELFPGLTIALLIAGGLIFGDDTGSTIREGRVAAGAQRWWRLVRRGVALCAGSALLVAVSALVHAPWKFSIVGIQLFSVTGPSKPLTWAIGLAILLALTSPGLRRACASRSVLGFYGLAAVLTWLFSLGPAPTLMGRPFMYRGPYALLMLFPGFNALRVPARFWMMTTLCLSVIGALLFDRLAARLGRARLAAAVVVSLAVLADGWVTDFPLAKTPDPWKVEACEGSGALVELPLGDPFRDVAAMYRGMSHGRAVVNGYSGYFPPGYAALRVGLGLHDDDVLTQLTTHGVRDIVVDSTRDESGAWSRYVMAHAGSRAICAAEGRTLYRLGPAPPDALLASRSVTTAGTPVRIAALRANVNEGDEKFMVDGDRATRWQSGPQSDHTVVDVDLGTERDVGGVQLLLGPFVEDFPRVFSIAALGKGAVWTELYRGGSAGRAFVGAFEAPRDVPMTFRFPTVTTRYLRLRTLANEETYYWSVAELKVLGSP
jgi:F5/8 type C domain